MEAEAGVDGAELGELRGRQRASGLAPIGIPKVEHVERIPLQRTARFGLRRRHQLVAGRQRRQRVRPHGEAEEIEPERAHEAVGVMKCVVGVLVRADKVDFHPDGQHAELADARGDRLQPVEVGANALLVHGMARLVQRAEQRVAEVALVDAGGDAHIADGELDHERVVRLVLATTPEIEAVIADDFQAEGELIGFRVEALEHTVVNRLLLGDCPYQRHELTA